MLSAATLNPTNSNTTTMIREAFDHCFRGTLIALDPDLLALDPAERLEFSRMRGAPGNAIARFDARPDGQLLAAMYDHACPLQRERAAWEFSERHTASALQTLTDVLRREKQPANQYGLLWLIQRQGGLGAIPVFEEFVGHEHPEVRDWAKLLLTESIGRTKVGQLERPIKEVEGAAFEQTLPLLIAGYARTQIPGVGWVQVTLSPQWFERILGRVMACTNTTNTFDSELVIEKRVREYHPDGSDHFEIFRFKGFSTHLDDEMTHHQYESVANHTFYPSGKVEDVSIPPVGDMVVNLARIAATLRVPHPSDPARKVVHSVRGRYMGWAYVDLKRVIANGMDVGPGEAQLSSLHHPEWGSLTNTLLYGSFKGKISDLDGDGLLDVNTEPSHSTPDGRLDYRLTDGPDGDPFDPLGRT